VNQKQNAWLCAHRGMCECVPLFCCGIGHGELLLLSPAAIVHKVSSHVCMLQGMCALFVVSKCSRLPDPAISTKYQPTTDRERAGKPMN